MRTVKLFLDEQTNFPTEVMAAIGRMAIWGISGFDQVSIYIDHSTATRHQADEVVNLHHGFTAVYKQSDQPERIFVLGAIWNKETGKYSYHS